MSPTLICIIGLVVLFALMAAGMPIGFAMALIGFFGYAYLGGLQGAFTQLQTVPYSSVASYMLTVLPLFILMGEFCFISELIRGAYNAMHKWMGHLPGGLAMATVWGCAAFSAVSGSSLACASTMTLVALPEMERFKYDPKLSAGSIACGGTLDILIPPSNAMIIYALFAEVSVGKLFMAGFIPGFLLSFLFMGIIYFWVKIRPALGPRGPQSTWREKLSAVVDIWPVAILAVFVLGGIYGGIFSPTEAAGAGAFGALIIGLVKRKITVKNVISALEETIRTSAMIFTILIGAMIFNYFIVMTQLPTTLAATVEALAVPPLVVLVIILFIYLILGCIMDTMAMTVLTLPIFIPILNNLGYNLVWFGIVFIIMCEMALITPPIGMNVFVIAGMAKHIPMYTIFKGVAPFIIAMFVCLVLVIAFPSIAMFLPNAMIGK